MRLQVPFIADYISFMLAVVSGLMITQEVYLRCRTEPHESASPSQLLASITLLPYTPRKYFPQS